MNRKALKVWAIDKKGKKWNTRPERQFREYAERRSLGLVQNVSLPFVAPNREGRLQRFDFQLDFARPCDTGHQATYDVDFEIDGECHNSKNDLWKDNVKNGRGLKVIHIPGVLTEKKFWSHLDKWLPVALLSKAPTIYIGGGSREFP